jgi:predicted aspartyl protease
MGSHANAYDAIFIIDISVFESVAPAAELRKIGIEPQGKRDYELASGEVVEYEYAFVELRFLDEITVVRILFGPDDAEPCLGRLALQGAGCIVDLKSQTITKLFARPLKKSAKIAIAG